MNTCAGTNIQAQTILKDAIEPGRIHVRHVANDSVLRYFIYVPKKRNNRASLFVSVHGISRNAREHAEVFAPLAEQYGVILIAPFFSRRHFGDYQRLGREGGGRRADHAIHLILDEVKNLTGADSNKVSLFGYSGGGQFVHRYAMAHPDRALRYVIGAAGWYTYPDDTCMFPYGVAPTPRLKEIDFNIKRFLQVPACVLVGQWDIKFDPGLNQSSKIQKQQGMTRLERGRRWIDAMNRAAMAHGVDTPYEFSILPGIDHDFTRAMKNGKFGQSIFKYLFGSAALVTSQTGSLAATPSVI